MMIVVVEREGQKVDRPLLFMSHDMPIIADRVRSHQSDLVSIVLDFSLPLVALTSTTRQK